MTTTQKIAQLLQQIEAAESRQEALALIHTVDKLRQQLEPIEYTEMES